MCRQWIGAVLVLAGCGGWGWSVTRQQLRQERFVAQLLQILQFMLWELPYRLTPLPELCHLAGREVRGQLRLVMEQLAEELEQQTYPEVSGAMKAVLARHRDLPGPIRRLLYQLGKTLGRFDLPGQIQGLETIQADCRRHQQTLLLERGEKLRSIRTLAFCVGAALVILLI